MNEENLNTNSDENKFKELGNEAYSNGRYEEAIKYFTEGIKLNNNNEILYCNRSISYSLINNWNMAINDAKIVK